MCKCNKNEKNKKKKRKKQFIIKKNWKKGDKHKNWARQYQIISLMRFWSSLKICSFSVYSIPK